MTSPRIAKYLEIADKLAEKYKDSALAQEYLELRHAFPQPREELELTLAEKAHWSADKYFFTQEVEDGEKWLADSSAFFQVRIREKQKERSEESVGISKNASS